MIDNLFYHQERSNEFNWQFFKQAFKGFQVSSFRLYYIYWRVTDNNKEDPIACCNGLPQLRSAMTTQNERSHPEEDELCPSQKSDGIINFITKYDNIKGLINNCNIYYYFLYI